MNTSKQFAADLRKEFFKYSSSADFAEIAQFRALQSAFGALKPKFQVEEYHGTRRQVYFDTTQPWLRPRARCELCDLLIISYSTSGRIEVRLMLLQAKLSRNTHGNLCCPSTGLHHKPTQFRGNYEQWDLLSARPRLDPTSVFAPPPDLLRNALVPSIGTFGVFHRLSSGSIDMFYASADTLQPAGIPTGQYGKLTTTLAPRRRIFSGFQDNPLCCCLFTFGKSLFELHLGSPVISKTVTGDVIINEPLASFARGILSSYLRETAESSALAPEVLELIGDSSDHTDSNEPLPDLIILKGNGTDSDTNFNREEHEPWID